MSNIKKGQKVKVLKPGIFNEMIGSIISISYNVDFGSLGQWKFNEDDLLPFSSGIVGESVGNYTGETIIENCTIASNIPVKQKRAYKKGVVKPAKETIVKRAYNRKKLD